MLKISTILLSIVIYTSYGNAMEETGSHISSIINNGKSNVNTQSNYFTDNKIKFSSDSAFSTMSDINRNIINTQNNVIPVHNSNNNYLPQINTISNPTLINDKLFANPDAYKNKKLKIKDKFLCKKKNNKNDVIQSYLMKKKLDVNMQNKPCSIINIEIKKKQNSK